MSRISAHIKRLTLADLKDNRLPAGEIALVRLEELLELEPAELRARCLDLGIIDDPA